jgi:hypothetical protein
LINNRPIIGFLLSRTAEVQKESRAPRNNTKQHEQTNCFVPFRLISRFVAALGFQYFCVLDERPAAAARYLRYGRITLAAGGFRLEAAAGK